MTTDLESYFFILSRYLLLLLLRACWFNWSADQLWLFSQHIGLPMFSPNCRPKRIYQMSHGVLNLPRNLLLDWTFGHSLINCHVEHHLFPSLSDNMCLKVTMLLCMEHWGFPLVKNNTCLVCLHFGFCTDLCVCVCICAGEANRVAVPEGKGVAISGGQLSLSPASLLPQVPGADGVCSTYH